jgi:hypothetical protein
MDEDLEQSQDKLLHLNRERFESGVGNLFITNQVSNCFWASQFALTVGRPPVPYSSVEMTARDIR